MITNNSKSKKQLKINNFFCTEKQETTKQKITRNSDFLTTPKFKLEQTTTKKASPKPKTTKKVAKINNKKEIKETKIEEENKKLRGYWTKLAKIQKSKEATKREKGDASSKVSKSPHAIKSQESQSEDLVFDGSPETVPKILTSFGQPNLGSTSTFRKNLPGNLSNNKVKLLEQPKLDIDVEGFVKLPD